MKHFTVNQTESNFGNMNAGYACYPCKVFVPYSVIPFRNIFRSVRYTVIVD